MEFYMFVFVLLLKAMYGRFRSLNTATIECDWSVERWHCPVYGTTTWVCLKEKMSCRDDSKYHCVRNETGKWIQICTEPKICLRGQEPTFSTNSGITCTNCRNKDRYEPSNNIESYKYSECRQKKTPCPEGISYECLTGNSKYFQNRQCRCANEKNFVPQNYDFNTDTWSCQDADTLNCVEDPCPEDASGRPQIRNKEYRCFVPKFPITSKRSPESSTKPIDISEKPTTTPDQTVDPDKPDEGPPTVVIVVVFVIIFAVLPFLAVVSYCYVKKRKQTGTPRLLKASDIGYYELLLSWDAPLDGIIPTDYILASREAKSLKWHRIETVSAENTQFLVTNLKAGTDYHFSVIGKSRVGKSKRCNTERPTRTKSIIVPGKPQGLESYFDDQSKCIHLKWDLPEDDGGIPILDFRIEHCSVSNGDWVVAADVETDTTEWLQRGLVGGKLYKFKVAARNKQGLGDSAETSDAVMYLSVPSSPTNIYATNIKSRNLTLNWSPAENEGGATVRKYYIRQKQGDNVWQDICYVLANSKCCKTIDNLLPGKIYLFSVSAENKIGKSEFQEMETPVTMNRQRDTPDIPVGPLKASDIRQTSLILSWQPPEDQGAAELTSYIIERKTRYLWGIHAEISPEKTEYQVKGLNPEKEYFFRIIANNSYGTSNALEMKESITTLAATKPAKPEGPLVCSDMTPRSVTVSWKPPTDDCGSEVIGYKIWYCDTCTKGDHYWVPCDIVKETTLTLKDLPLDGEYFFKVCAVNAKGDSQIVHCSSKYIPRQYVGKPKHPVSVAVKDDKETKCTLFWESPEWDGGLPIEKYHVFNKTNDTEWHKIAVLDGKKKELKVRDLSPGRNYCFRVHAENKAGIGDGTEIKEFVVLQRRKDQKKKVDRSVSSISSDSGGTTARSSVSSNQEPSDKTDDARNVEDGCTVDGLSGSLPDTVDLAKKPDAPGKLQVTETDSDSMTLHWTNPNFDGSSKIVNFIVAKRDENSEKWENVESVKPSMFSIRISAEPYKRMYYSVAAENAAGIGPAVEIEEPVEPHAPPSKPAGQLLASGINVNHLTLSWRPPRYTGGSPVTNYILEKKDPFAVIFTSWKTIAEIPGEEKEFRVEGLAEKTGYIFRVSAENIYGKSEPLQMETFIVTKRFTHPLPPLGPIKYSGMTEEAVTLTWQPPEDDDSPPITHYKIEYKLKNDPVNVWKESGCITNQTNWTQHGLLAEQEYLFRVIAVNAKGESEPITSAVVIKPVLSRDFFQNVIDAAKAKLTAEMDTISVLDALRRHNIGTEQDYQTLQTERGDVKRNEKLLQIIKANGADGADAYKRLKVILAETNHTDLMIYLKNLEDELHE